MNNKKLLILPVSVLSLLAVFSLAASTFAATPNFVTGLGIGSGYKINFSANADGVTWTGGTGGSINASNYTGTASTSVYSLTAGSATNATTANSLAANGSNCSAGNYPLGVDASGNVESCTAIPGGISGSGTLNYITKWSGATGLTTSLIFDNGTNVGIGLTSPGAKLDVSGGSIRTSSQLISTVAAGTAPLAVTSNTLVANLNADLLDGNQPANLSVLYATSAGSATSATTAVGLAANGTNCSAGYYPLGVDDKGNVESCTAAGGISGSGTANYIPKWSGASGLGNSVIYNSGNKVGIGITNPSAYLEVTTDTSVSGGDLEVIRLGGNYDASLGGSNSIAWYGWMNTNKIAAISGVLDSNQQGILTFNVGGGDMTTVSEAMRINYNSHVSIATSSLTTTLNLGGKPGIDGLQFPDGTIQTTAVGAGSSLNATNVSAGVFGANVGGGNYFFPVNVGIGMGIGDSRSLASLYVTRTSAETSPLLLIDNVGCENNNVAMYSSGVPDYPTFMVGGLGSCQTGGSVQINALNVDGRAGNGYGILRVYNKGTTMMFDSEGYTNYMKGYLRVGDNVVNNAIGSVGADSFCLGSGNDCLTSWADNGAYTAAAGGTTAFNFQSANVFKVTPTATATYTATVGPAGQTAAIIILTSGTTSRTITFGTGFKTTGTLTTGTVSGKYFTVNFVSDGSSMIETSRTTAM